MENPWNLFGACSHNFTGIMYLKKAVATPLKRGRQADAGDTAPEITPQMVEAGAACLRRLLQAGTGSAYTAEEVYRAMAAAASDSRGVR